MTILKKLVSEASTKFVDATPALLFETQELGRGEDISVTPFPASCSYDPGI
jgi:hypothetical protein